MGDSFLDPSQVQAIESMGFSRIQAENGLRHGRDGTITAALEWIMNQPPMSDAGVGFSGVIRGDSGGNGDADAINANQLSEEGAGRNVGAVALSANAAAHSPETEARELNSNPSPDVRDRLATAANESPGIEAHRHPDYDCGGVMRDDEDDPRQQEGCPQDIMRSLETFEETKERQRRRQQQQQQEQRANVENENQISNAEAAATATTGASDDDDSDTDGINDEPTNPGAHQARGPPPFTVLFGGGPQGGEHFGLGRQRHGRRGSRSLRRASSRPASGRPVVAPEESQSSLEGSNGTALFSSHLVVENSIPVEEEQQSISEDKKVYEVAEKVISGHCYCGKRKVDRRVIAVLVTAALAIVVALSVAWSQHSGSTPYVYPEGTCGEGNRGNGLCRNGQCCSPYGHCGDSPEHCVLERSQDVAAQATATIGPMSTDKICGGYYADWNPIPTIENIHPNYNVVNLFAARGPQDSPDGTLTFTPPYDAAEFQADVIAERSSDRKRSFALSVGGTGWGFEIPDRAFSERLLDSIKVIYEDVGGLDGLDWDIFKDNEPSTDEMIWIGNELKSAYPGFFLSASVVPYRGRDREFCRAAIDAGALDFCTPVFYNGQGLSTQNDVLGFVADWAGAIGEEHLVIGLAVYDQENFQSADEAKAIYREIKSTYSSIRGVFHWNVQNDFAQDTNFARDICNA